MEKTMKEMLTAILALSYEKARDEDYEACEGLEFYACRTEGLANILMFGRAFYLDATMPENPRNIARIKLIYRLSGLAERDAVAKEREIAEEYLSRLKAERARNTALVEALDQIKKQYGLEHGVLRGERPVINSLGEFINEVLEANTEKGGSDAA